jgi:PKD repeat protein
MFRITLIFFTILFLGLMSVSVTHAENSSKWVTGYYIGYEASKLPPENIYWPGLTHIVMGAITAYPDGSLNTNFYNGPKDGPSLAIKISKLAHQNNKKALLMLGGEGTDENISLAIKNNQSVFISNLVNAMNTYGYDGFDLDWEGKNVDYNQFVSFAQALRKAAPNAILTVPVGCINPNVHTVDPGIVELSKHMDQVNLMSYYPVSVMTGLGWYSWFNSPLKGAKYNTPISIENSLSLYNASGIPKNKLGMGIGLFAIGYTGSPIITSPNQDTNTNNILKEIELSSIYGTDWINYEKYCYWSDEADVPYLSLPSPGLSGARYISFENPQSITEKGNFTRDNGYGGIIIWNLNKGYVRNNSDPNFLMKAIQKGFLEQTVPFNNILANFTCNVTQGYAPLSVKFNDTSTGAPTNWNWNFGDGNNSNEQNPTHAYSTPGKYSVTLTVSNSVGSNTTTKLDCINVSSSPTVTIFADNFDSYSAGTFPSSGGWNLKYNGYGSSYQKVDNSQYISRPNSLKLEGKSNWAAAADHNLSKKPDNIIAEVDVKVTRPDGGTTGWANAIVNIVDPDVDWGKSYGMVVFGANKLVGNIPYNYDQWYHVKIQTDMKNRIFNAWVNGTQIITNSPVPSDGFYKTIRVTADNSGHTCAWFDNLKVTA